MAAIVRASAPPEPVAHYDLLTDGLEEEFASSDGDSRPSRDDQLCGGVFARPFDGLSAQRPLMVHQDV